MTFLACLFLFSGIALISIGALASISITFGMALGVLGLSAYLFGIFLIRERN